MWSWILIFHKPSLVEFAEAVTHTKVFLEKGFLKKGSKLQENTPADVRYQQSCFATLLKSHFGMGVLL